MEEKFERYQSPGDISIRVTRVLRELQSIENTICVLELASDDPDSIKGQLEQCLVIIFLFDFKFILYRLSTFIKFKLFILQLRF